MCQYGAGSERPPLIPYQTDFRRLLRLGSDLQFVTRNTGFGFHFTYCAITISRSFDTIATVLKRFSFHVHLGL